MKTNIKKSLSSAESRRKKTREKLFEVIEKIENQDNDSVLNVSSLAKLAGCTRMTISRWLNDPEEQEFAYAFKRVSSPRLDKDILDVTDINTSLIQLKNDNAILKTELKEAKLSISKQDRLYEQQLFLLWKRHQSQQELIENLSNVQAQNSSDSAQIIHHPGKNVVISPDSILHNSGDYSVIDEVSIGAAWAKAKEKFEIELSRELPTAVVLTIGIAGSGKSTWVSQILNDGLNCAINRRVIVLDATNLTIENRKRWISITNRFQNIQLVAACFITNPEVAYARQAERPRSRQVPKAIIQEQFKKLEFPVIGSEEIFSDIIVTRT